MDLPVFSFVVLAVGALIALVGGLMLLIAAFRESVIWGLVVFFVPLGNIIYTCVHWTEAKAGFLTCLVGTGLIVAGVFTLANPKEEFARALHRQFPELPGNEPAQAPTAADLDTQIAEKRKIVEDLQAAFASTGRDLPAQYQALEKRRKALKAGDEAAITKFNEEAAAYQAQNNRLKDMQREIAAAQSALDQLLETRSRAAAAARTAAP
jgi:hypothetical protein